MRWYKPRSKGVIDKIGAERIAHTLRLSSRFSKVRVVKRTLPAVKLTKTPKTKGYWIKVELRA